MLVNLSEFSINSGESISKIYFNEDKPLILVLSSSIDIPKCGNIAIPIIRNIKKNRKVNKFLFKLKNGNI
jgi:hypothetical protein